MSLSARYPRLAHRSHTPPLPSEAGFRLLSQEGVPRGQLTRCEPKRRKAIAKPTVRAEGPHPLFVS